MAEKKVIALFDVDGTLTPARKVVTEEVLNALKELRSKITIGFVGGSDLSKQREQLGENGRSILFKEVIDIFNKFTCFILIVTYFSPLTLQTNVWGLLQSRICLITALLKMVLKHGKMGRWLRRQLL